MGIRLYNTSAVVDGYDVSDDIWEKGMTWALAERMALNNATIMAEQLTREEYGTLAKGPHGEMYFGCSNNIRELPHFGQYVENGIQSTRRHFAVTRYGVENIDHTVDVVDYLNSIGQPTAARDVAALADALMSRVVENVVEGWRIRVDKVTNWPPFKAAWEKIWAKRARIARS